MAGNGREFRVPLENSAALRGARGAKRGQEVPRGAKWFIAQPRAPDPRVSTSVGTPDFPLIAHLTEAPDLLRCGKVGKINKNAAKSLHRMSNR